MSDLQVRGPLVGGTGSASPFTADITGAQRVADAHGRYAEAVRRGNVFFLNVTAGAATAFVGAAAGTPLIGLYNPVNSGKQFELVGCSIGSRVAASAAGTAAFNLWGGPSVLPTGTITAPTNGLTLLAIGSSARGFVNTAMTGSTAITQIMPVATYYWATAASSMFAPSSFYDLGGIVNVQPGNLVALGATAALTSATYDVTLFWEEVPLLY